MVWINADITVLQIKTVRTTLNTTHLELVHIRPPPYTGIRHVGEVFSFTDLQPTVEGALDRCALCLNTTPWHHRRDEGVKFVVSLLQLLHERLDSTADESVVRNLHTRFVRHGEPDQVLHDDRERVRSARHSRVVTERQRRQHLRRRLWIIIVVVVVVIIVVVFGDDHSVVGSRYSCHGHVVGEVVFRFVWMLSIHRRIHHWKMKKNIL